MARMMKVLPKAEEDRLWAEHLKWERYREIRRRKFEPITGYEPDPKREEWQQDDCWNCPHFKTDHKPFNIHVLFQPGKIWSCELKPRGSHLPLGDPSFCRFSEYRRILFKNFT